MRRKVFDFTRGATPGVTVTAAPGYAQGPDGLLSLVAANTPRFEYDPADGRCLGLLVEPAATNLLRHARDLTAAPWTTLRAAVAAADAGATGAADGGTRLNATAPAAVVYQTVSGLTPGKRYTFSAYVRGEQRRLTAWSGSGPWVTSVAGIGLPTRLMVDGVRLEHRLPGVDTGWPAANLWRYDHAAKTVTINVDPAGKVVTVDLACLVGALGFFLGAGTLPSSNPVRHRTAGRALSRKSQGVPQLYIEHAGHPFIAGDEVWFTAGTWDGWAPPAEAGRRQNPSPGNCRLPFTVVADLRAHTRDGSGAPAPPPGYVVKLPEAFRFPQHIPGADGGSNVGWLGGQWWRLPHLQTGRWHRVYATRTAPPSGTLSPGFFIQADYAGMGPYDFSGEVPAAFAGEGFLVDFCQLQEGDYPTSPIVTGAVPASRGADVVQLPAPGGGHVPFSWGATTPELWPVSPLAMADRRVVRRVQLQRAVGDKVHMTVTSSHGDFARHTTFVGDDPPGEPLSLGGEEFLVTATDAFLVG